MISQSNFSFLVKKQEIYNKYMIGQIFPYSVLTDTDSICVFFILICRPESNLPDENEILHRCNTSHKFWEKKKLRYCSIKIINHPCIVTIAVNPKEYFEKFESENISKKHKGLRKGAKGIEFENYSKQIILKEIETFW